jgi:tetratricopeptide (TPR) repeat protein
MNSQKRFPKVALALASILVLALVLRFNHLGSRPLYGDETFHTVDAAAKSLPFILTTNFGSILDTLLIHFLLPLGKIETMARLPSALFGLLSVWIVFLIGKRLWGKKEGLIAAFLTAVSTPIIFFSQEARGYTGLLFFSLVSLYFFERSLNENKARLWIFYALFTAIGLYAHFFLLVILPVHAAVVVLAWFGQRIGKNKPSPWSVSNRTLLNFAASAAGILILTFLLYLPTRKTGTLNAYSFVTTSVSSLLRGEWNFDLLSFFGATMKRLLAYGAWPPYFFIQLGLLAVGFAASLGNRQRDWALFLAYLVLPFVLFALSNPPYFYATPQPSKFLFLLPVLFLWIAHGLVKLASGLQKVLAGAAPIKNRKRLAALVWTPLLLGILLCAGVELQDYQRTYWKTLSLDRDGKMDAYLQKHGGWQEAIYFDDYRNKQVFLMLFPVTHPDGRRKGIAVFESDYDYIFQAQLFQNKGLWAVLESPRPAEQELSDLRTTLDGADVEPIGRHVLVHLSRPNRSLYENTLTLFRFLLSRSTAEEQTREIHLQLAKVYLLARNKAEAMKELDTIGRLYAGQASGRADADTSFSISRLLQTFSDNRAKSLSQGTQEALLTRIGELLREQAEASLAEDRFDEALALQTKAEETLPQSLWDHLSAAESYQKEGLAQEARQAYLRALFLGPFPKIETFILKKIRGLYDIPFGYFLWQRAGAFHLRWFSQERDTFSGSVRSSRALKGVGDFHLLDNDRWKRSKRDVIFQAVVEKGRVEGLDIAVRSASRLTFSLKIDGREKIGDRVILLPEGARPPGIPFSLQAQRSP